MSNHQDYLITLDAPPSLAETVVDFLLLQESEHGFSTYAINSHHHGNQGLSLAEQVRGRQQRLRFQLQIDAVALPHFMHSLKQELAGSGIHYWVLPILEKGAV